MMQKTKQKSIQNTQPLAWQIARGKHIFGLRINQIIQRETSAEHLQYCILFAKAADSNTIKSIYKPALRMLSAIMSMGISTDEFGTKLPQFKPMFQCNNGSRSAVPSDFIDDQLETIKKCAQRTHNLIVKTRLEHLVWNLDSSDWKAGQRAIDGYIETLEAIYSRKLFLRSNLELLGATSTRTLKVLVSIHRYLGSQCSKEPNVKRIVTKYFHKSIESKDLMCILRFGEISAQVDQINTIRLIEKFVDRNRLELSSRAAELWRLLADTYLASKNRKKYERCKIKEAEIYATMARKYIKKNIKSANEISIIIKSALTAYHGIPGVQRRFINLRKMLVDVEKKIPAEMMRTRKSVDVKKFAHSEIDEFKDLDLAEVLVRYKSEDLSPDPDEIKRKAKKIVTQYPIQFLGRSEMKDDSGKTIAITKGLTVEVGGKVKGNLDPVIMNNEAIRRGYCEAGFIGPARVEISRNHRVSKEKVFDIIRSSPTVPAHYRDTLSAGFEHYFNEDWTAAAYILVPMLEGILRHGLLLGGYDIRNQDRSDGDRGRLASISEMLNTRSTELANVYNRMVVEDMYRLFCTKWGPSLRHRTVHALHDGNIQIARDASYACWLIWKVVTLRLFLKTK